MCSAYRLLPPLRRGDLVAAVAPSGAFDRARFQAGLELIAAAGLRVAPVDPRLFERHRYLAGPEPTRAQVLHAALQAPEVKALWAARGGYGATRLLEHLEPDLLARHPKLLIGFSDITVLHAQWQRAGWASVHGANITTLADWSDAARAELMALLFEPGPISYSGEVWVPGGAAQGPLVGGNLTVLAAMAGTGRWPPTRGAVVLLEDVGEQPYRLDRSLTQLRLAGLFDGAVAVVVGQLTHCDPEPGANFTLRDVVIDVLGPLGVPVLGGLALGHEASSRAALLGGTAQVDPTGQRLVLTPPKERAT